MTVSSETSRNSYTGNDVTVEFAVSFYFLVNTDIRAILYNDATDVETELEETTHYTLVGAGEAAGGTLTMIIAPTSDETLTILRELALTQERDYIEHTNFPAESHEQALDKLTMLQQQINEKFVRTVRFKPSSPEANIKMENLEAGKALVANGTAEGIAMGPTIDEIADAQTHAETALAAKIAAEAAQTAAETAQTAAETAQTAAETAETNAETAETNAETAQTAAETAQTAAETAQTAAETAQTAAELAETNATASEAAAAASEAAAAASASAAAASASAAAASASAAAASASAAAASASAAAASAAGVDLPDIQAGDADKILQVKDDESGHELVTPASLGLGDVIAAANIDANAIVVGDDGVKGVKKHASAAISAAGTLSGVNQIAFPATAVPSADPNTLDDYEEGTWTPDLQFGGAKVGITYGTQTGTYNKTGNAVCGVFQIVLTSKGSSSGAATIDGLPFSMTGEGGGANITYHGQMVTGGVYEIRINVTALTLGYGNAAGVTSVDNADFNNDSHIRGFFMYIA